MLVIFDCDGVLVDSEPIANRVLAEALGEAGHAITAAEAHGAFLGLAMRAVVAAVERESGRPAAAGFPGALPGPPVRRLPPRAAPDCRHPPGAGAH